MVPPNTQLVKKTTAAGHVQGYHVNVGDVADPAGAPTEWGYSDADFIEDMGKVVADYTANAHVRNQAADISPAELARLLEIASLSVAKPASGEPAAAVPAQKESERLQNEMLAGLTVNSMAPLCGARFDYETRETVPEYRESKVVSVGSKWIEVTARNGRTSLGLRFDKRTGEAHDDNKGYRYLRTPEIQAALNVEAAEHSALYERTRRAVNGLSTGVAYTDEELTALEAIAANVDARRAAARG
jgi:hypothetical protein